MVRFINNFRLAYFLLPIACCLLFAACNTVDLYEKVASIPGHSWKNSFKPSFSFTIKDSTSSYQLFLILRHTDKYNFNNIYVNLSIKTPGADSVRTIRKDLTLATNDKGWLGVGMDDIYEHRIKLGDPEPLKKGDYTFTIEQIMRQDPLEHILNAGIRIEKTK